MRKTAFFTAFFLALPFGAIKAHATGDYAQFTCDAVGDGYHIVTLHVSEPDVAYAYYQLGDGENTQSIQWENFEVLERAPSASPSGFRFIKEGEFPLEFFGKHRAAILSYQFESVHCRLLPVEDPIDDDDLGGAAIGVNVAAKSYGGRLRQSPSADAMAVGSLPEGAAITLLENTGVELNGYPWFLIRYTGGEAYHWGGIICWLGEPVAGVYQACENR